MRLLHACWKTSLLALLALPAGAQRPPAPVLPSAPLAFRGKARYYVKETFNPGLAFLLIPATFTMASPPHRYPAEWRQGAAAFGRNFGDFLCQDITLSTVSFAVGAALREDPRYFPSQTSNPFRRAAHALSFVVVDRSDTGHRRLALSNLSGAAASGFLVRAYHPDGFNDNVHAGQNAVFAMAFLVAVNLVREFAPELKAAGSKLHVPGVHDTQTERLTP